MYVSSGATALPQALKGSNFNISSVPGVKPPGVLDSFKNFFSGQLFKDIAGAGLAYTQLRYGGGTAKPGYSSEPGLGANANPTPNANPLGNLFGKPADEITARQAFNTSGFQGFVIGALPLLILFIAAVVILGRK